MHNRAREYLRSEIIGMVAQSKSAAFTKHQGVRGAERELLLGRLLNLIVPAQAKIGTGEIIDSSGATSKQSDVLIYEPKGCPPFLVDNYTGSFAVESIVYGIEVKSRLNAAEIKKALAWGRSIRSLYQANGTRPHRCLFAFDSNLKLGKTTELERYAKYDKLYATDPAVNVICVVGRGYWFFDCSANPPQWEEWLPDVGELHEEVIDFISGISNTLSVTQQDAPLPGMGVYAIRNREIRSYWGNFLELNKADTGTPPPRI